MAGAGAEVTFTLFSKVPSDLGCGEVAHAVGSQQTRRLEVVTDAEIVTFVSGCLWHDLFVEVTCAVGAKNAQ